MNTESNGPGSLPRIVIPPDEIQFIAQLIRAEDQRVEEMTREAGLPKTALDAETKEWWVMERAWMRWGKQQSGERLSEIVAGVAEFYYKHTENHALLSEAADRLKRMKPRRHNDPSAATRTKEGNE